MQPGTLRVPPPPLCKQVRKGALKGKSRYVITEPNRPHLLTYTVKEWLPVFGGSLGRGRWSVPGCIPTLERGNDVTISVFIGSAPWFTPPPALCG